MDGCTKFAASYNRPFFMEVLNLSVLPYVLVSASLGVGAV